MPTMILSALFVALLATPMASSAQWLNPHLDNQRWSNLRKHQQKLRQQNASKNGQATKADTRKAEPGKVGPGKAAASPDSAGRRLDEAASSSRK
jgi:Ni/Co efflux regulator RcnB